MLKYDLLGYTGPDEYLKHFVDTLIPTNRTYNYYVDWKKIKSNLDRYVTEISILNSLTHINPEESKDRLRDIILKILKL